MERLPYHPRIWGCGTENGTSVVFVIVDPDKFGEEMALDLEQGVPPGIETMTLAQFWSWINQQAD